jgi:hypothetical protein
MMAMEGKHARRNAAKRAKKRNAKTTVTTAVLRSWESQAKNDQAYMLARIVESHHEYAHMPAYYSMVPDNKTFNAIVAMLWLMRDGHIATHARAWTMAVFMASLTQCNLMAVGIARVSDHRYMMLAAFFDGRQITLFNSDFMVGANFDGGAPTETLGTEVRMLPGHVAGSTAPGVISWACSEDAWVILSCR